MRNSQTSIGHLWYLAQQMWGCFYACMCSCVITWGCRVLQEEGECRGPAGHSYSSWMECLTCWWAWPHCCWGSEGRLAVCEWMQVCVRSCMCVSENVSVCAKERETGGQGERERERYRGNSYRNGHDENLKFSSSSVSQSGTICSA